MALGFLDFSSPRASCGGEVRYFDKPFPRLSFLDIFLERVARVSGMDRHVAVVHPDLRADLMPVLSRLPWLQVAILPAEGVPAFYQCHGQIVKGRKWAHQSIRGGLFDATIYDEQVPMELLKDLAAQVACSAIVHLHPEAPLFNPEYASQALAVALESQGARGLPLVVRQSMLGLCPAVVTSAGLEELKKQNWRPLHVFRCNALYDGMLGMRKVVPNNVEEDIRRGRFLLRSRRDAERLKRLLRAIGEAGLDWSVGSLARMQEDPGVLAEEEPRELDVELTDRPYPEACRMPRTGGGDMPLGLFDRIYSQACAREDCLFTLGEYGDISRYPGLDEVRRMVADRRPFGMQAVFNAASILDDPDAFLAWMEIPLDVLAVRLTPLCCGPGRELEDFEPILSAIAAHTKGREDRVPIVQLLLSKHEDLWRSYHRVHDWAQEFGVDCNWVPYNDHAGQLPPHRETISYAPLRRYACEKSLYQMYVLPDGTVPMCKTDFRANCPLGHAARQDLRDIWSAEPGRACRLRQAEGRYNGLCAACRNWMHT